MRKRDTHDEIAHSLENDTLKLKYPDRVATLMLNSPHVSNIKYGKALDVDEMNEKLNKSKIIENLFSQMSSNTNTHHTYNNYHFKPLMHLLRALIILWMMFLTNKKTFCARS